MNIDGGRDRDSDGDSNNFNFDITAGTNNISASSVDDTVELRQHVEGTLWCASSLACPQTSPLSQKNNLNLDPKENNHDQNFDVEIRVFISSTFTDFFAEREFLVKFIFPRLRAWCLEHGLHLVEVDLRWGVPSASSVDVTLHSCLGEIDRCIEQNKGRPFFINMLGDRYGWIPSCADISSSVQSAYNWVPHASVTHMEILHAAYRSHNPNALFMLRSGEHVKHLPPDFINQFVDSAEYSEVSLKALKDHIRQEFKKTDQVFDYTLQYEGIDNDSAVSIPKVKFNGLSVFGEIVFDFLQRAIEREYLASSEEPETTEYGNKENRYEELCQAKHSMARAQQTFFTQRHGLILGREAEVISITNWLHGSASPSLLSSPTRAPSLCIPASADSTTPALNSSQPFVVFGARKVGKSTMLCVDSILKQHQQQNPSRRFIVFHSLQAEGPESSLCPDHSPDDAMLQRLRRSHLVCMLHIRLCLELGNEDIYSRLHALSKELPSLAHVPCEDARSLTALMFREEAFHEGIRASSPAVIVIDEADQLQSDFSIGSAISFLSFPLPDTVKCILSTSSDSFFTLIKSLNIPVCDQCGHLDDMAGELESGLHISSGSDDGANSVGINSKKEEDRQDDTVLIPPTRLACSGHAEPSLSPPHSSTPSPWLVLMPLGKAVAAEVIQKKLARYQKTLDADQLRTLLRNTSATNFEWIEYACEEIRTFGAFETISDHIKNLPASIEDLLLMRLRSNEVIAKILDSPVDYVAYLHATLRLLLVSGGGLTEEEVRMLLVGATYSSTSSPLMLEYTTWSIVFLFIKPFIAHSRVYAEGVSRIVIRSDTTRQALIHFYAMPLLLVPLHKRATAQDVETTANIQQLLQLFATSPNKARHSTDYPKLLLLILDKSRLKNFLMTEYFDFCSYSVKYQIRRLLRCTAPISSLPIKPHALRMCINCSMASTLHPKRLNRMSCYCCGSQIFSRFQTMGGKHSVILHAMEGEAFKCRRHSPQSYHPQPPQSLRLPCALCKLTVQAGFSFPVVICRECKRGGAGGGVGCLCAHMG